MQAYQSYTQSTMLCLLLLLLLFLHLVLVGNHYQVKREEA